MPTGVSLGVPHENSGSSTAEGVGSHSLTSSSSQDFLPQKARLLKLAYQSLMAEGGRGSLTLNEWKAVIYVKALSVSDSIAGQLRLVQASILTDIEQGDMLRHHPDRYESLNQMLHETLRNDPSPSQLSDIGFVVGYILPTIPDVIRQMDETPSISNLRAIVPQARRILRNEEIGHVSQHAQQQVADLVQLAARHTWQDLRAQLSPPRTCNVHIVPLGDGRYEVTSIMDDYFVNKLLGLYWINNTTHYGGGHAVGALSLEERNNDALASSQDEQQL